MGKIFQTNRKPNPLKQAILAACLTLTSPCLLAEIAPENASAIEVKAQAQSHEWMVVTANPLATEAAAETLRNGGSAIDAAISAQMVLGLVEPQSSGIGGGGFLLYWDAENEQLTSFDGRETAPFNLTEDHFLEDGKPMPFFDAVIGGHAVGTPGLLHMLETAHQQYGKLPWASLFVPAQALASEGFELSPRLHTMLGMLTQYGDGKQSDALKALFFKKDGTAKAIGTPIKNPAYAKTMQLIASQGSQVFYQGEIAEHIVEAVQNNPLKAGTLTLEDLKAYQTKKHEALCSLVGTYKLCGPPPPASGPLAIMQILAMLNELPEQQGLAFDSAAFYHRFAEVSRLAFADRNQYVADPAYSKVPVTQMLEGNYLKQRASLVPLFKAGSQAQAGSFDGFSYIDAGSPELPSTSHLSIIDSEGNIVSMTSSIETAFGSRLMVDGFLLNNQLTDFSFSPRDEAQQAIANRIEPGKRPRSSMAPMIVFSAMNQPALVIGSPGGSRIIAYVAKTIAQHLYMGAPLDQAIQSAHVSQLNGQATEVEQQHSASGALQKALAALGHQVKSKSQTSGIHAISISAGNLLLGVADPRREGSAIGGE